MSPTLYKFFTAISLLGSLNYIGANKPQYITIEGTLRCHEEYDEETQSLLYMYYHFDDEENIEVFKEDSFIYQTERMFLEMEKYKDKRVRVTGIKTFWSSDFDPIDILVTKVEAIP